MDKLNVLSMAETHIRTYLPPNVQLGDAVGFSVVLSTLCHTEPLFATIPDALLASSFLHHHPIISDLSSCVASLCDLHSYLLMLLNQVSHLPLLLLLLLLIGGFYPTVDHSVPR